VEWTWDQVVVPPGDPGTWDSGRHNMGDVVFDGTTYHMYLVGGPGFTPIDNIWSVGHWEWDDILQTWLADSANPVLVPEPGQWDAGFGSIAVLYDGATFHMWFSAAAGVNEPSYVGYATDADGRGDWTKYAGNPLVGLGPGAPGAWDDYGTVPKTVLVEGSSLRMWYVAFQGGYLDGTWRIGHARSTDGGITWNKEPDTPVLEAKEPWEGNKAYQPTVVRYGDRFAMWYTGYNGVTAALGYAVSPDGLTWTKWPANPVLTPRPGCNTVDSSEVILLGDTAHGWVSNCYDVYHVTAPMVLFADDFESGGTSGWSAAVP
jgi:hypothetical protein